MKLAYEYEQGLFRKFWTKINVTKKKKTAEFENKNLN